MDNLAATYSDLNKSAEAEQSCKAALLVLMRNGFAQSHPDMILYKSNLAGYRAAQAAPIPQHAMPAAIEPQQTAKPNEPCPCGKGKKYKKCCGKLP
jgi:hypothetical protein